MRGRAVVFCSTLFAVGAVPFAAWGQALGAHETKLVGRGLIGAPNLGWSVAVSGDGRTRQGYVQR